MFFKNLQREERQQGRLHVQGFQLFRFGGLGEYVQTHLLFCLDLHPVEQNLGSTKRLP